jgi:DNA repair protein RecO (recombination protein O)
MHWSEDGIVISTRSHGETSVVLELFTRDHGRHLGLVRGGRSRRLRPVLQPGNSVRAHWRARLAEHLGAFTVEPLQLRVAALIDDPLRLAGLTTMMSQVQLVPEREAHVRLFDALQLVLEALDGDELWPALIVRWEFGLLEELGFGLDLETCAATGGREDLTFVSPKSGRAVSTEAGRPYAQKLYALPQFLLGQFDPPPTIDDICAGFALTGYFLNRHVFEPRGLQAPESRERLVRRIAEAFSADSLVEAP